MDLYNLHTFHLYQRLMQSIGKTVLWGGIVQHLKWGFGITNPILELTLVIDPHTIDILTWTLCTNTNVVGEVIIDGKIMTIVANFSYPSMQMVNGLYPIPL